MKTCLSIVGIMALTAIACLLMATTNVGKEVIGFAIVIALGIVALIKGKG